MRIAVKACRPIVVIEPNAERRKLALELGAHHVIDPAGSESVQDKISAVTAGSVDTALDTSGVTEVIEQVLEALALRGKLAIVTAAANDAVLPVNLGALLKRGISIRGVTQGDSQPQQFIPQLVELIMEGRFPLQKLVRFYSLDEINSALADQQNGVTIKPIIRLSEPRS
ncbi:zinc-binding dehydrogenase [Idiomarina seosinensis]|uniref:zinc-binding dehydrogenase n=1 Tax=Idiomarina seosinensis TaxID=281739 RepID=UPI00384F6AB0